jgi:transcriptional regulator with XRE-family HTH domain
VYSDSTPNKKEMRIMAFDEKLRTARKEKGLTQEQLAELLGVSRQAVTKWEAGEGYPEVENLILIAEILELSLDALLLDKELANKTSGGAAQENRELSMNRKISIRSFDGNTLSAYDEFSIVKMRGLSKRSPKCLILAKASGAGLWDAGANLGWYTSLGEAQKELAEINASIQNGESLYTLKYCAKVKGFFNPKIIDESRV